MKCTEYEFFKIIGNWNLTVSFYSEKDYAGRDVIFVIDNPLVGNLPYNNKYSLASHVWVDGAVIKDTNGLFASPSLPLSYSITNTGNASVTVTLPTAHNANNTTISINGTAVTPMTDRTFTINPMHSPICECGKEKHGFASHSGWCDIKE